MYGVNVRFFDSYKRNELRGGEYYYEAYDEVRVGDVVVVDTSRGFAVAQVTSVGVANPGFSIPQTRTIVQVVDYDNWNTKELERLT